MICTFNLGDVWTGEDHDQCIYASETLVEVTNNGRDDVLDQGWFISVIINEKERVYLALEDLEASLKGKQMMTFTDVLTKLNEWGHQLNLALDQKNKEWFMFVTRKLLKLQTAIS